MILILLNRLVRSNNPRKFETNSSPNSVFRIMCLETQNVRSFDIPWVAERTAHAKSRKVLPESVQICVTIPKAPRRVVPLSLKRPGEASPRSLELLRFYKKERPNGMHIKMVPRLRLIHYVLPSSNTVRECWAKRCRDTRCPYTTRRKTRMGHVFVPHFGDPCRSSFLRKVSWH